MGKQLFLSLLLLTAPSLSFAKHFNVHARCGGGAPVGALMSYNATIVNNQSYFDGSSKKMSALITVKTDSGSLYQLKGNATLENDKLTFDMQTIAGYSYSQRMIFLKTSDGRFANSSLGFCASQEALNLTLIPKETEIASEN